MKSTTFSAAARLLHWLMAVLIIAMLFIGVGMVSTVGVSHNWLVPLHKSVGATLLLLVLIRLVVRATKGTPPLPVDMPAPQKAIAHLSHLVLYALMIALPLVGWSMLSAGGYPITVWGAVHLPPLLSPDRGLYASLRHLHTYLAYALFLTVIAHLSAALMHAFIFKDGVFQSMAAWRTRR
ncbi:cytochrome b [Nitrospirillum sp. BR 11163]|uniref:cytochrome b n=1 Tax=Nitrospirillum sp. BR 11163 TaxID=3104323 RepID=UPI002AFE4234|nr:cytochrome b/b6 domain-containing protein [Nitrospirillum sp. BR 11163]MEA1676613.1 cytochrome b/b6 domain-containing protein [Nitrospirillum sp. BR 11163]